MPLSAVALAFLEKEEGFKTTVYPDSGGRPTIGVGHLLTPTELAMKSVFIRGVAIPYSDGLTTAQVTDLLGQDCEQRLEKLAAIVTCPLSENQQAALFSLYFNAEPAADSGLFETINGGDWTDLESHWTAYCKVRKDGVLVVDQELVGRRAREWKLWDTPDGQS